MDIFAGISLTVVVAAFMAALLQGLRQPVIIGHILTGLIVGPFLFVHTEFKEVLDSLSQIGIALLLFIIGLSLSPKVMKEVGKSSLTAGALQVAITSVAAFLFLRLIDFPFLASAYLALAITFSSTIVIMKLLSDKKELGKFYSKISIGILLFQDLVVALLLVGISAFPGGMFNGATILSALTRGLVLVFVLKYVSTYLIPNISSRLAKSQEVLFLFALAWGLGFGSLFYLFGFPVEIGALIAGISLSSSPYHFEISTRLKPVRDFFIILFFIVLGSRISPATISEMLVPAVLISLFVIAIKPMIVCLIVGLLGHRKKVTFMTAVTFTQISEFSVILIIVGERVGHLDGAMVSLITLVGLITIAISSYVVLFAEKLFPTFQRVIAEKKKSNIEIPNEESYDVVLFGCNRIGFDFIENFKEFGNKFLVVDYNPDVVRRLTHNHVQVRYGDVDDNEFLNELHLDKVKMVISTVPDFNTNEFLIGKIRDVNPKAVVMVISLEAEEAIDLYEAGATYVITPHFLGGKYASMLISKYGFNLSDFIAEKEKHLSDLQRRRELGHAALVSH